MAATALVRNLIVRFQSQGAAEATQAGKQFGQSMDEATRVMGEFQNAIGQQQQSLGEMAKGFAIASAPIAAFIASFTLLARQGFSGTVEMERFNFEMLLLAREAAGVVAPALRMLTDVLRTFRELIQSIGPEGQKVFVLLLIGATAFLAIGTAILAVLGGILAVLLAMAVPLAPLFVLFTAIAAVLVTIATAVIGIDNLGKAFKSAASFVGEFLEKVKLTAAALGIKIPDPFGIGNQKAAVTLAQVGTETPEGTFARVQEAILRLGVEEDTPQIRELRNNTEALRENSALLDRIDQVAKNILQGVAEPQGRFDSGTTPKQPALQLPWPLGGQ